MRALISRHLLWLCVAASVVALALAAVLEWWMPYRREWNQSAGDVPTDLASAAVLIGAVDPLLKAALPVALVALWPAAAQADWALRLSSSAPFALQVLAALLWIELAKYGAHRWHHSNRAAEANCNFGSAFLLWDHVFGTYDPEPVVNIPKKHAERLHWMLDGDDIDARFADTYVLR